MRPGVWGSMIERRMSYLSAMLELVDEGLDLVGPGGDEDTLRLREIGSYCRFAQREFSDFASRWRKEWEKERNV
jgi:hypothetical protein